MQRVLLMLCWLLSHVSLAAFYTSPETTPPPANVVKQLEKAKGNEYGIPTFLQANDATNTVVYVDKNGAVRITREGQPERIIANPRPTPSEQAYWDWNAVSAMTFSVDKKFLYVGSRGGGLRELDLEKGMETGLFLDEKVDSPKAHQSEIRFLWLLQNPNNAKQIWLVSASRDTAIKIWDVENKKILAKTALPLAVSQFWQHQPDQLLVTAAHVMLEIRPSQQQKFLWFSHHTALITNAMHIQNRLWSKSEDNTYVAWNPQNARVLAVHSPIQEAVVSKNTRVLAVLFGTNAIQVYKGGTLWQKFAFPATTDAYSDATRRKLLVSENGRYLVLAYTTRWHMIVEVFESTTVFIWDLQDPKRKPYVINNLSGEGLHFRVLEKPPYFLADNFIFAFKNDTSTRLYFYETIYGYASVLQGQENHFGYIGIESSNSPVQVGVYRPDQKKPLKILDQLSRTNPYAHRPFLTYSPSQTRAAVIWENRLYLWNTVSGKRLETAQSALLSQLSGADRQLLKLEFRFSDDSRRLLLHSHGKGTVWNADSLEQTTNFLCKGTVVSFTARGILCNTTKALVWLLYK